jgi:hypothetical protein
LLCKREYQENEETNHNLEDLLKRHSDKGLLYKICKRTLKITELKMAKILKNISPKKCKDGKGIGKDIYIMSSLYICPKLIESTTQ